MSQSIGAGILSFNFFEVATVVTIGSDLRENKTAPKKPSDMYDYFTQNNVLYRRRQYFEYDRCEIDDELKEKITQVVNSSNKVRALYDKLEINSGDAVMKDFDKAAKDAGLERVFEAIAPNDIRLVFDNDGSRTIMAKILTQVPFQKTREHILEQLDAIGKEGKDFLASIAIQSHMRFLPASAKGLSPNFKQTLLGLH